MTVRVDTFETSVNSESWPLAPARTTPATTVGKVVEWWQRKSISLTMSEEWLQEHRRSSRTY